MSPTGRLLCTFVPDGITPIFCIFFFFLKDKPHCCEYYINFTDTPSKIFISKPACSPLSFSLLKTFSHMEALSVHLLALPGP